MISRFCLTSFLTVLLTLTGAAADQFLILLDYDQSLLESHSGRFWGYESGKAILSGDERLLGWLHENGVDCKSAAIDMECSALYVWYGGSFAPDFPIILAADDFAIAASPPPPEYSYRRLNHRRYKARQEEQRPEILVTYDPVVDQMIDEVSQDTILDFLSRLTGAEPIEIDGQPDTIHTRYSGTPDNSLAAEYLKETLADYGYQSEFHGFYGGQIRHMASYDENLAWIVTENSEFLKTSDGGQNWDLIPDGTNSSLWGVANWGPDLVWIAGNNGTIRFSNDGGETFAPQNSGSSSFLFGVSFADSVNGWIAGDYGSVLHTSNGGQNWSSQNTPTSSRLYDINFVDSQSGWACGRNGTVIHTSDGGQSWVSQNSTTSQRLYGIDFIDQNNGWTVGWGGVVRRTTDGGDTWQTVNLGTSTEKYHVEFSGSSFGCVAGWDGEIFVTVDGGEIWEEMPSGTACDFHGLTFVDNMTGYAGGDGGLMKTTDGGLTWFSQTQNIETAWQNVIATKPGTTNPEQQVVICGHMDDRSEQPETYAPGADDNGSGTTAVIEAARIFADYNFEKTIKFCLWTGEEQGLLGSAAYAAEAFARGDDIIGVFNFDMIAWDGNGDGSVEFHTGTSGPSIELGNLLVEVVNDYDIALAPDIITWGATGASDHASFWDYNYAAMLGIEDYSSDFNPYYHSTGDHMDHIDAGLFYEFTKAAVGATATLAVPDTTLTFAGDSEAAPDEFTIRGNYPNPFNTTTIISFRLDQPDKIEISIFDLLGCKVATLYDGYAAAGAHRLEWAAGEVTSGVYFCSLRTADGKKAVSRMTLIK